jgi:hypothetical protein
MFKTSDKAEAMKELLRIGDEIEKNFTNFNTLRAIPTILCLEDAIHTLHIEYQRKAQVKAQFKRDSREFGFFNFIREWNQFTDSMIVNILNKGFLDCTTKRLDIGINVAVSIERDYQTDFRNLVSKLREENYISEKYVVRIQERKFLNRYPGAMIIILDGKTDKKIIQTLDKILQLRQLMYKRGLLETMVHLAPQGTEINFNDKETFIKYPEQFTVESAYEKIGLSHRLMESYTHITSWNSDFADRVLETLQTISGGKSERNIEHLKLEQQEVYDAYHNLVGFPQVFRRAYGIELQTFFDIINEFIFECYPHDNTLGTWEINDLKRSTICKKHKLEDVKQVVYMLSNLNKDNLFYGMLVVDRTIFSTFGRLTGAALSVLDSCLDTMYENDLKGKNFEDATRKMLKEKGLLVIPQSVEIFEPMVPKEIAFKLWGKEKERTDLDIIALKDNALLIVECKDTKLQPSLLKRGNKFKNFVMEQYYRVQWIRNNYAKFTTYVQNESRALGLDLTQKLLLFPLVVSNTLANIEDFEGAPLMTYSELEDLASKKWDIKDDDPSQELTIEINGRLHHLPWFASQ